MLYAIYPKLYTRRPVAAAVSFCESNVYPAVIVLMMVLSELFSLEMIVLWSYLVLAVLSILFTKDSRAVLPIAVCSYMTLSRPNSTVWFLGSTVFDDPAGRAQFIAMVSLAVAALVTHLVFSVATQKRRPPRLLSGFLALGAAYVLGGAFSPAYGGKTVLFGAVQFFSLAFLYVYFRYTLRWETLPEGYLPALMCLVGVGVFVQIVGMYRADEVWTESGVLREQLFTGWGMYNNVACIMAMCLPAPFYFAVKRGKGFLGTALASLFLAGIALTQSRGGIVFGGLTFFLCACYAIRAAAPRAARRVLLALLLLAGAFALAACFFTDTLNALFRSLLRAGLESSSRLEIYSACWKTFLQRPLFGVGFYATPGFAFDSVGNFLPPRAHNTYLQLLSTGGLVLAAAYLYHRVQTVKLLLVRPTAEKMFVLLSVLALLLTSIVDCHFFNIGPPILYGILLAYAEAAPRPQISKTPRNSRPEGFCL